jgi:large subunit ribosomal protein L24e
MVVKYQTCNFSEYKIAPGKGLRYCEVNGKQHTFISKKCRMLFLHSKKPLTIRWTLKWRTAHKKGKVEDTKNRNNKQKKERTIKAVVGFSLDEIKKIREANQDDRGSDAMRYKYVQEIKEKKKRFLEKTRKTRSDNKPQDKFATKGKVNIPKNTGRGKK